MSVIKKFLSVLIFALMLMPTCFADDSKNFVKVSDCDVTGFYFKFNDNALNSLKNNVTMQYSPVRINSLSTDDYGIYFTICESKFEQENTAILFKTIEHSTDILSITVLYNPNPRSKSDDVYMGTFKNIFKTIGLTDDEMKIILDSIKENRADNTIVNCKSMKKFVEVIFERSESGINSATISVFVTK